MAAKESWIEQSNRKIIRGATAILMVIYLINPGAGFVELIPDNIPFLGNVDELLATLILTNVVRKLTGFDLASLSKQLGSKR